MNKITIGAIAVALISFSAYLYIDSDSSTPYKFENNKVKPVVVFEDYQEQPERVNNSARPDTSNDLVLEDSTKDESRLSDDAFHKSRTYDERPMDELRDGLTEEEEQLIVDEVQRSLNKHKEDFEVTEWSYEMNSVIYDKFSNHETLTKKGFVYMDSDCRSESCLLYFKTEAVPEHSKHRDAIMGDKTQALVMAMVESGLAKDNEIGFNIEGELVRVVIERKEAPGQ